MKIKGNKYGGESAVELSLTDLKLHKAFNWIQLKQDKYKT